MTKAAKAAGGERPMRVFGEMDLAAGVSLPYRGLASRNQLHTTRLFPRVTGSSGSASKRRNHAQLKHQLSKNPGC
jgi:hypothetical protein